MAAAHTNDFVALGRADKATGEDVEAIHETIGLALGRVPAAAYARGAGISPMTNHDDTVPPAVPPTVEQIRWALRVAQESDFVFETAVVADSSEAAPCTHPDCERHGKSPGEGVGGDGLDADERAERAATTDRVGQVQAGYAAVIEAYADLRSKCYRAAVASRGALMGADAWLCFALGETDLELEAHTDGIYCYGTTYTTQTMSNENFEFTLSYANLTDA